MEHTRPVIGIPAALAKPTATGYVHQQVGRPYVDALVAAGATPLVFPVTPDLELVREMMSLVDGVLLQGGGDIAPRLYGQDPLPMIADTNETTDTFEMEVARRCVEADFPLLAICRGIQVLNVAMGGSLIQDLPAQRPEAAVHRQPQSRETPTQHIHVTTHTRLAETLGETDLLVNTFHHQAIDRVGSSLVVVATSDDTVIEAVEVPDCEFVLGVQFHPEETTVSAPATARLFERLVSTARERRARRRG